MFSVCRCTIARATSSAVDTIARMSRPPLAGDDRPPADSSSLRVPRSHSSSTRRTCAAQGSAAERWAWEGLAREAGVQGRARHRGRCQCVLKPVVALAECHAS